MTPGRRSPVVKFRAFVLALAVAAPALAEPPSDVVVRIDTIGGAAIAEKKTAGISLTVLQGPRVLVSRGYGSADLENDVPVTAETVFAVGSITKQFTAAAILKLADEGRLSLEDSLGALLPDVPAAWRAVRVRQLLNHTAGIHSMTRLGPKYWGQAGREIEPRDLIALFADTPLDFPAGTRYAYSNSGYVLLGAVLEKVTGKSYGDVLDAMFFKPLGLKRTYYGVTSALVKNRARGYSMGKEGFQNAWFVSLSQGFAAGGVCSTSPELAAWTRTLHTKPPLLAASYKRMVTPETLPDGKALSYGYGVGTGEIAGHRLLFHAGGLPGFDAQAEYFPAEDVTIVVLCNSDADDIAVRIATDVARVVLDAPSGDARYGDHVVNASPPSP